MDPDLLLVPALVIGFPLVFGGMWAGVSAMIAWGGGWRRLARAYGVPELPHGAPLETGYAVRIGWANYQGVVSAVTTDQGLGLEVSPLFPFHPPLLLPWSAVGFHRGLFGEVVVVDGVRIRLGRAAHARVRELVGGDHG